MTVLATNYENNKEYSLLEKSDILNALTSTATDKALSANQGKVLNDKTTEINGKLFRLVKIYNNSEVIQITANSDIFPFLSKQNIADRVGVNVSNLNTNNVILCANNGDSASNDTRIIGSFYSVGENVLYLNFREYKKTGGMRVNYTLMYFSDNDKHE